MSLTIGSLFSGIGGLELGLEWAGLGPVVWQVEIDPFCRRVLAKHWPEAKRFEDVRLVGAATLAPVGIICGGFPCQDVSLAGRGAGLAGERSALWFEYLRVVQELRPRAVVIENVPGLLRRGLDVVVSGLSDAGYEVEGTRIRAEDLGAPHRRGRLFIVAYSARDGTQRGRGIEAVPKGGRQARVPPPGRGPSTLRPWSAQSDVRGVAHGIPDWAHRLRALGNTIVPQCAYVAGRRVIERLELDE